MGYYVMQVDCFKRNYKTNVCSDKCKFRWECQRAYTRELENKLNNRDTRYSKNRM